MNERRQIILRRDFPTVIRANHGPTKQPRIHYLRSATAKRLVSLCNHAWQWQPADPEGLPVCEVCARVAARRRGAS